MTVGLAKTTTIGIGEDVVDLLTLTTTIEDIDDAGEGEEIETTIVMMEVVSLLTTTVAGAGVIGLFHRHRKDTEIDEGIVQGLDLDHDRPVTEERGGQIVVPMEIDMARTSLCLCHIQVRCTFLQVLLSE